MFCRSFLLSTFIIFAVIFVSNLNATKCYNFQLQKDKDVITHEYGESEKECSVCTSYICKDKDYKKIVGSACIETVKEICQQKWDDSMFQKIAENGSFVITASGDYFFHSCQEDFCMTVRNLSYYSVMLGEIMRTDFFPQKSSHHNKSVKKCIINGEEVPCDRNQKRFHHKKIDWDNIIVNKICYQNRKPIPCDEIRPWHRTDQERKKKDPEMKADESTKIFAGLSDQKLSSRHKRDAPDENDVDVNIKVGENGENGVAASMKVSETPDENTSIKYGNGFALIIASFFAYLFFIK